MLRETPWLRRAQPLLGTLVEIGVLGSGPAAQAAMAAAFDAVCTVQACLSRFDAGSDVARFHRLRTGEAMTLRPATRWVLAAARELQRASDGAFDVSLGTGASAWQLEGDRLHKLADGVRIDLGGLGKGHAVDSAVAALLAAGIDAGWVNAGGDLRAFGGAEVPIRLRDEAGGGTRPFASISDGAFATSHFGPGTRSHIAARPGAAATPAHVSVAAPLCLWADALTKVVALSSDTSHPLLARFGARAWLHRPA